MGDDGATVAARPAIGYHALASTIRQGGRLRSIPEYVMADPSRRVTRPLGTMVAYGFERGSVHVDLDVADRLGVTVLEILPDWMRYPDPLEMRRIAADRGFTIHSAHGCWGGTSIKAARVDLGSLDRATWEASLDDLKRCLDWLAEAGGTHLVVHPGGLSEPADFDARRGRLRDGLIALGEHVEGTPQVVCVENMPPGVHPGSRMVDLAALVAEIGSNRVGVALDTGHANLVASTASETIDAGRWLRTTHVHDNNGRQDRHEPPGEGTIDWVRWAESLDAIGYEGPIMLECIRILRREPDRIDLAFLERLQTLLGGRVDG